VKLVLLVLQVFKANQALWVRLDLPEKLGLLVSRVLRVLLVHQELPALLALLELQELRDQLVLPGLLDHKGK
jgi:hypothetical protein